MCEFVAGVVLGLGVCIVIELMVSNKVIIL